MEGTRDTDMDRDQRLAEAAKDAQAAIDNIGTDSLVPPNAPPERVAAVKASILTMAYNTLGMVDLNKKDYAGAEQQFMKAVDASKAQPEAVVYLRLSVAQDQLKKYPRGTRLRQQGRAVCAARKRGPKSGQAATGPVAETDGGGSGTAAPGSIAPATPAANRAGSTNAGSDTAGHRRRRLSHRIEPRHRRTRRIERHGPRLFKPSNAHES